MNENQERVNRQVFWMVLASFLFVTLMNFQGFFMTLIRAVSLIPSWWLLVVLPLFGIAVIYSIHRGEEEIRIAEKELYGKQQQILEIERQFRLIKSDLMALSPFQFTYYCTDLLKVLGYEDIQVKENLAVLTAKNKEHQEMYIACIHEKNHPLIDLELMKKFELARSHQSTLKGLIMTTADFTEEALVFAKDHEIESYNGIAISKLVWLALASTLTKEKAPSE